MNILRDITFHLCDLDKDIVEMWEFYFADILNFKFHNKDIFLVDIPDDTLNAIVSPSNSFGDLQGGIDLVYYKRFGHTLEERLQQVIIDTKFGELVIGDALILQINKFYSYQFFISAPTMRVPMCINVENNVNVYLAFRAILIELIRYNSLVSDQDKIQHVVCPGLGTGIGKISPEICAKQMYQAYMNIINPSINLDLVEKSCEQANMTEINSYTKNLNLEASEDDSEN